MWWSARSLIRLPETSPVSGTDTLTTPVKIDWLKHVQPAHSEAGTAERCRPGVAASLGPAPAPR